MDYPLKIVHEIPVTFKVDLRWPNSAAEVVNTLSGQKVRKFEQKLYRFRINARQTSSSNEVSENDNGIEGTFSRNGSVMFDQELKVIFTSKREVTTGELQYRLKIQTL